MTTNSAPLLAYGSRNFYRVLALLIVIQFLHIVDFMMLMPLAPFITQRIAMTTDAFGALVSSYSIMAGIAALCAGFLLHHFDRKYLLAGCFALFGLLTLLTGFTSNYNMLMAVRIATGLFGGLLGTLVITIVAEQTSYEHRGRVMGMIMSAFSLATIVGVPFALWVASHWGWHMPFWVFGAISLLVLGLLLNYLPAMPAPAQTTNALAAMLQTLTLPIHWLGFMFITLLTLAAFTVIPFITMYNVHNLGVTVHQLPWIYIVGGIATLAANPLIGKLSDKYNKGKVLGIIIVLSCIPLYSFTHLTGGSFYTVLCITTLFFVLLSGRNIPSSAIASQISPLHLRANFMSMYMAVQSFAMGLAALLGGKLLTTDNSQALIGYNHVGALAIAFSGLALLCIPWLQRAAVRNS